MRKLRTLLEIKDGEAAPTAILFAYFFFFGATLTVGKTARDAYFLSRFDIAYLPLMFLLSASAVAILATVNYFASKRLDITRNLFRSISLSGFFLAISLISIQNNLNGLLIPFLYVWIDVITIVINFQLVIYAGMVFNSRQAKRLFGIILCGSPIARIIIGAGLHPFVGRFGSDYLLTLTAGFIICCVLMAWFARPYIQTRLRMRQGRPGTPKKSASLDGYLKILALATGAAAVATVVIEYQFLIFSKHTFASEEGLAVFFGTFYSLTGFVSLFAQLFLTRWILTRFGILSAMRVLPAGLGIGALAILFNPSLLSAMIGRASEQITKFTLNKTSVELLWIPVSPDQKQRKKLFIDDTIKTGMQGLTGILIYTLIKIRPLPYPVFTQLLSLLALVAIGIWLFTTSRLKNGYVSTLASAIEKRRLDIGQLRSDTADSNFVEIIDDALDSGEEAKQVFALELISRFYLTPWSETLKRIFKKGSLPVQAKVLALSADHPGILSDADLRNTIDEGGPLARDAMIVSGKRNVREVIPALTNSLENRQPQNAELCAAAATAILMMKRGPVDLARSTLQGLLCHENEDLSTIALRMMQHIPDFLTDTQLGECCQSDSINVCSAALDIARRGYHVSLIPSIIYCLKHPQTRAVSRRALENYPSGDVAGVLNEILLHGDTGTEHKVEIIRTLKDYPNPRSISILVQMLKHPSLNLRSESVDTLLEITREYPLSVEISKQLNDESRDIARYIYSRYNLMGLMAEGSGGVLLHDLYASEIAHYLPILIKLLALPLPEIPVETYIEHKRFQYGAQADNLIEIFDNVLPRKVSGYVIPLLRNISNEERCRAGRHYFTDLPGKLDPELIRLISSSSEYRRTVGLDYAISQRRVKVLGQVDWTVFTAPGIHSEMIAKYVLKDHGALMNLPRFPRHYFQNTVKEIQMLSILEKTIILKGTNLFEGVPGENIFHVAQVMEEERLGKGASLFAKGDKGDYFYIIVTGEVLIHVGEKELARHGKGEYFGEMALLDDCPRSSSATALEETLLLKINQDNFLDIMLSRKEVGRSIMRIISARLRRLTDQYAGVAPS